MPTKVMLYTERWIGGGIEAYLMNLLRHVNRDAFSIELWTAEKSCDTYDAELSSLGVPLFVTLERRYRSPIRRTLHALRAFRKLGNRVRTFDVVHIHMSNAVSMCHLRTPLRSGVPIRIAHSHNSSLGAGFASVVKRLGHELCKRLYAGTANHNLACSSSAAHWMFPADVIQKHAYILAHNGIDLAHFHYDEGVRDQYREELALTDRLVVGHVGRMSAEKNHRFLLEVFHEVRRRNPGAVLLLIGDGELRASIEQRVRELHLEHCVFLLGARQDVANLYQAMDVFVLPSLFEGLPIVGIEAQASGLPCIFSDTITNEVALTGQCVFLPLNDVVAWATCIGEQIPHERSTQIGNGEVMNYDAHTTAKAIQAIWNGSEWHT